MSEGQKRTLVIVVAAFAVALAGYSIYTSTSGEKEEVVGTLPMPEGGGRNAEKGDAGAGADPSGMPPGMANPGGEGKG